MGSPRWCCIVTHNMSEADGEARPRRLVSVAAAQLSMAAISPPQQGDAVSGLTQAIAGVGSAVAPELPGAQWPEEPRPDDAWAVAVDAESGWYVLLSQDCDIVDDDEPTVQIAPLVMLSDDRWQILHKGGYSSRYFAYPDDKFVSSEGLRPAVDLAWVTTVLKGSLGADAVRCVRPFTGPNRARFSEWLAARLGRVPFPDEIVENVLAHFDYVRNDRISKFSKAQKGGGTASIEARVVGAAQRWYARVDGRRVHILGELTGPSLAAAGFVNDEGQLDVEELTRAQNRFAASVTKRINAKAPDSGYEARITLVDLAKIPASQFREFALLIR